MFPIQFFIILVLSVPLILTFKTSEKCLAEDKAEIGSTQCNDSTNSFTGCLYGATNVIYIYNEMVNESKITHVEKMSYDKLKLTESSNGYLYNYDYSCDKGLRLIPYLPTEKCSIEVIRSDPSLLVFRSESMNYYEVFINSIPHRGTFTTSLQISLTETCSKIYAKCGRELMEMHLCYRKHRECYALLNSYWMPARIVANICEFLHIYVFLLISIAILSIINFFVKSGLVFIIFPFAYPICYIYFKIADRFFSKCNSCGLLRHPLTVCGLVCKCGRLHNSTGQLRVHIKTANCKRKMAIPTKRLIKNRFAHLLSTICISIIIVLIILPTTSAITEHEWKNLVRRSLQPVFKDFTSMGFDRIDGHFTELGSKKRVTLQGVGSDRGTEESFLFFEMPILKYQAASFKVFDNDQHIFDFQVKVVESKLYNTYSKIYKTGKTKTFQANHDEKCTGTCQNFTSNKGWLKFSKEHTSNWGCEEFGCLAMNDGCLWGSCSDVVSKDLWTVYEKKNPIDKVETKICFYFINDGFCTSLETTSPLISEKFEIQATSRDTIILPERLIISPDNELKTGQINGISTFGRYCGDLKVIGKTVVGEGEPQVDYVCHNAKRKDVTIKRCMHNHFHACTQLEPSNLQHETGSSTLNVFSDYNVGSLKIKLKFGKLVYKGLGSDGSLKVHGLCSGCIKCSIGVLCNVTITSSTDTSLDISSDDINFSLNRVVIKTGRNILIMKGTMGSILHDVVIKFGPIEAKLKADVREDKAHIDILTPNDDISIKLFDSGCSTWICKMKIEGFNGFRSFFDFDSSWLYAVYGLVFLMILMMFKPVLCTLAAWIKANMEDFKKDK